MKKKFMGIALVLTGALFAGNVSAATVSDLKTWQGDNVEVTETQDSDKTIYTLKLTGDAQQDIEINNGETVIIDLAGHKLTNYYLSGNTNTGHSAAIWIQKGAKVTIKGNGEITQQSGTSNVSVITNEGELTIDGNVKISDAGRTESTAAPTIGNSGVLTINNGEISTTTQNGAAIFNYHLGTMTINNATIKNGTEKTSGITNEGIATINGGTFTQGNGYSMILNRAKMTINDGIFNTIGDLGEASLITNEGTNSDTTLLTINKGKFESNVLFIGDNANTLVIKGGDFKNTEEAAKYLAEGLEIKDGKIVKVEVPAPTETDKENEKDDEPKTSDVFPMALVGMISLGLAGTYVVKKAREN